MELCSSGFLVELKLADWTSKRPRDDGSMMKKTVFASACVLLALTLLVRVSARPASGTTASVCLAFYLTYA
jgi:hypothetical protein